MNQIALAVCLAVTLVACGGSDSSGALNSHKEDALAQSMLLERLDLREEWTIVFIEEEEAHSDCEPDRPEILGSANRTFTTQFGDVIKMGVSTFKSEDRVQAALKNLDRDVACLADEFNKGAYDNADLKYSGARVSKIESKQFGNRTELYRIQMDASQPGFPQNNYPLFVDMVFIVVDRVGISFLIASTLEPLSTLERNEVLVEAQDSVRTRLAALNR